MRRFTASTLLGIAACLIAGGAAGQVTTGAIQGTVSDNTGAVLPGVQVVLGGERLIGGPRTRTSDARGGYQFEGLPPGAYDLSYQVQGFKAVERKGIRVDATFVATVNVRLELGQMEDKVTVVGESPVVDTKSNVQQTVMSQDLLEGIPTGRDPWSVAKIIPGLQVSTYDVGGTQGMQQSNISSHGSNTDDKVFAIDGLTVNWPGGGGGSTMVYYDQGMFEQVNFQTSAIPAEVSIGGVYMNMVVKEGGNRWRGDLRGYYADEWLQAENHRTAELQRFNFAGGNPVTGQYDVGATIGGPLKRDELWLFAAYRDWKVDKQTLGARNPDGSFAIDDNRIRNWSAKLTWQASQNHKLAYSYNIDNKQRFHRRDTPPAFVEDKASYIQDQWGWSTQGKYTAILGSRTVFESGLGYMYGVFPLHYQDDVRDTDIRIEDAVRNTASGAAQRHYDNPNSRLQFDNGVSYTTPGFGGQHQLKLGVQFARQFFEERNRVNGDLHILFNDGVPNAVRIYNTPTKAVSRIRQLGFYAQDSWTIGGRLTLNLGGRLDLAKGWIPDQDVPAGRFIAARRLERRDVVDQSLLSWRTGFVWDVDGSGRTAVKGNYSRYGNQVGINRVTQIHPFTLANGTRSWTDRNGDRIPQDDELGTFTGFAGVANRYADADGPAWPYSDELTLGVERQLFRDLRAGVMYYHRTNRRQVGFRNAAIPTSAYSQQNVAVPAGAQGPGGSVAFYNLSPAFFGAAFNDLVYDNQDLLDTEYDGVEVTLIKRMSGRWQLLGGATFGKNRGGLYNTLDLNDPNNLLNFQQGIVGNDSAYSLKLAGSYVIPWAEVNLSGSVLRNQGYPFQSQYTVTRTAFPQLTRASQLVRLSERGDERYRDVTLVDLRLSRSFAIGGGRRLTPQLEVFNLSNASTIVGTTVNVGSTYLRPTEILAPRIFRLGATFEF